MLLKSDLPIEDETLEYKRSQKGLSNDMWETFCAFENTYGGTIVLGVTEEKHKFIKTGIENNNVQKILDDFYSILNEKNNYENGKYDSFKGQYSDRNYYKNKQYYKNESSDNLNDFQKGYNQAKNDYNKNNKFKHYPKIFLKSINFIVFNKMKEIIDFIDGYTYFKQKNSH